MAVMGLITLMGGGNPDAADNPKGDTVTYAYSDRGVDIDLSAAIADRASGGYAQGDTIDGL